MCVTPIMKRGQDAKQASVNGKQLPDCLVGINGQNNHEGLSEEKVVYHRLANKLVEVIATVSDSGTDTISQVFGGIRPAYEPLPSWTDNDIWESLREWMVTAGQTGRPNKNGPSPNQYVKDQVWSISHDLENYL